MNKDLRNTTVFSRGRIIFTGLGLIVFFWLFESLFHVILFKESFIEEVFDFTPHELWQRLVTVSLLILIAALVNRLVKTKSAIKDIEQKLTLKVMEQSADLTVGNETLTKAVNDYRQKVFEYETILKTTQDGFWIIGKDGHFLEVNDAYCSMIGYTRNELLNMTIMDIKGVTTEESMEHIKKIIRQGDAHFETRHKCRDGMIIDVEVSATYLNIRGGILFEFIRNITKTKEIRVELINSKEKLESLVAERTSQLEKTNQELVKLVNSIEGINISTRLINSMTDMLHSANTLEEAYKICQQFIQKLLKENRCVIYILNSSKSLLESAVRWGEPQTAEDLTMDDCWALRRGQIYRLTEPGSGVHCNHIVDYEKNPIPYICVPMMAHGELVGIFHAECGNIESAGSFKEREDIIRDISEHTAVAIVTIRLREILKIQSIRDPLTGLFNRRYLYETLERELNRAERKKTSIGAIIIDIDHFKNFNDTFGHEAGDMVLKNIGDFLKSHCRGSDIACRFGGEEFILILPDASLEETKRKAEELREGVKKIKFSYNNQPLDTITISAGIASSPEHGTKADELINNADTSLYKAKGGGRDRVVVCS